MSSFLKWIGGCVFLTLPFSSSLFVGSVEDSDNSAATSMSLSQFETRISEIATSVQRRFAARVEPQPVGSSFSASDPRHLTVRDRFLSEHFDALHGGHLCRLRTEGDTIFCEIKGLKLKGPFPLQVAASESALGISTKLYYDYHALSFRLSNDGEAWNNWTSGVPPSLSRLELIRHGRDWSINSADTSPFPGRPPL